MKKTLLFFCCSLAILSCIGEKYPDGWKSNNSYDWYIEKQQGEFFLRSKNDSSIRTKWSFDNREMRFEAGFMKIKFQNRIGLLNRQGKVLIHPIYDDIIIGEEYPTMFTSIPISKDTLKNVDFFDWFDYPRLFIVLQNESYGIVSSLNKEFVPIEYDKINIVPIYNDTIYEHLFALKSKETTKLVSIEGEEVFQVRYKSTINSIKKLELDSTENLNLIKYFSKNWKTEDNCDYQSSKVYHIDGDSLDYLSTKNKILYEATQIEFNDWTNDIIYSIAKDQDTHGLSLNQNPEYSEIQRISYRKYKVELPVRNIGVIDIFENIEIPFEYSDIRLLKDGIYVVQSGLKLGILKESKIIIPLDYDKFRLHYSQILNTPRILESDRWIIGAEKEDDELGVWGAINIKTQETVIPFEYKKLCPINDCSFFVLDDESWKIIDVDNNIILDTNTSIDEAEDCNELREWLYKIEGNLIKGNSKYKKEKKRIYDCYN